MRTGDGSGFVGTTGGDKRALLLLAFNNIGLSLLDTGLEMWGVATEGESRRVAALEERCKIVGGMWTRTEHRTAVSQPCNSASSCIISTVPTTTTTHKTNEASQ